eukprot:jgi/Tetstr1/447330/TSEL_034767.t1
MKNYPGLLRRGFVDWSVLDENRHRRGGGFSLDFSRRVVDLFNQHVADPGTALTPENLMGMSGNAAEITGMVECDDIDSDYDIPEPVAADKSQVVYTPFPRVWWDTETIKAYCKMVKKMQEGPGRYIVDPWNNGKFDAYMPMARWNLLLNQTATNIIVNSADDKHFSLRLVLPPEEETAEILKSAKIRAGVSLKAVLLLRYKASPADLDACDDTHRRLPPGRIQENFFPLFVTQKQTGNAARSTDGDHTVKRYETYRLYNYAGNEVEWGDFSKRRPITYYEMRDIMSHLAAVLPDNEAEKWYMYEGDCTYDGASTDFFRFKDELGLEESVRASLQREDLPNPRDTGDGVDKTESKHEMQLLAPESGPSYVPPSQLCRPELFGVYGTECPERVCRTNHLVQAFRSLSRPDPESGKEMLSYLGLAHDNAGQWVSDLRSSTFEYGGGTTGSGAANWWGVVAGIGLVVATAFSPYRTVP